MTLDLFGGISSEVNLLPYDGSVFNFGHVLSDSMADVWFSRLLKSVTWSPDKALVGSRLIETARHVAWYGEQSFFYKHSGVARQSLAWNHELLDELRTLVQQRVHAKFNSCVLNLYHDGSEGMAWHSDSEASYGEGTAIASLSLGATRKFAFKHMRSAEKRELMLRNGQLIVMQGETQRNWLHAVMKTTIPVGPRISLTFRNFLN